MAHIDEGRRVIDQIVQKLEDVGKVEAAPRIPASGWSAP